MYTEGPCLMQLLGLEKNSNFTLGKYLANAMFWIIISLLRFLSIFGQKIALIKKQTKNQIS